MSFLHANIVDMKHITVIAGAGLSASAGIPPFRGAGGSWTTAGNVRNAFNLSTFNTKPKARAVLWEWLAKSPAWNAEPTPAHLALKKLDDNKALLGVFTQNFDGLEKKSGIDTDRIHYLHGSMERSHCQRCGASYGTRELCDMFLDSFNPADNDYTADMLCHIPNPKKLDKSTGEYGRDCLGTIKPNIIFFEENLDGITIRHLNECIEFTDELWVIGSSLQVYPVADLPKKALAMGKPVIIVNKDTTMYDRDKRATCIHDDIDSIVPALVDEALAG